MKRWCVLGDDETVMSSASYLNTIILWWRRPRNGRRTGTISLLLSLPHTLEKSEENTKKQPFLWTIIALQAFEIYLYFCHLASLVAILWQHMTKNEDSQPMLFDQTYSRPVSSGGCQVTKSRMKRGAYCTNNCSTRSALGELTMRPACHCLCKRHTTSLSL